MSIPLPSIRRGAEPFLLEGGEVGCVCVHGFTGAPNEMRWLGEYLHAHGLTVYGPRLAGHGTDPAIMARQHWLDWYESVLDGLALVRSRCRKVFVAGLSMGGLLSLRVAAAGLVDGAAVLAAPLYVNGQSLRFARFVRFVRPYVTQEPDTTLDERVRAIQRQMGREEIGHVAYGPKPVAAAAQLYALMGEVRRHLHEVTVPLLLIYSRGDQTVPFGNLRQAAEGVRSADVVQCVLERSDHVMTEDVERETVYAQVWEFIAARMG